VDTLEVRWSSGRTRTLVGLSVDAYHRIREAIRVPADHPTIQAALDQAATGETVWVEPGLYTGAGNRDLDFGGRDIRLETSGGPGASGSGATIIDCEHAGRAFHFHGGETGAAIVDGFTIQHGTATHGAVVLCESSSPTFAHCVFRANTATASGTIACQDASVTLDHCTFHANAAGTGAGLALSPGSSATITNSIIAFASQGEAIACSTPADVTVSCTDIYGNAGGDWTGCIASWLGVDGNVSADPLFCASGIGDLRLADDSPCAPEHSPAGCGLVGAWPVGCAAAGVFEPGIVASQPPRPAMLHLLVSPNPVHELSRVEWFAPHAGTARLSIYDAQGRIVAHREIGEQETGRAHLLWGELIRGRVLVTGVYFAKLEAAGQSATTRLLIVR
jgi:hypothetical protein